MAEQVSLSEMRVIKPHDNTMEIFLGLGERFARMSSISDPSTRHLLFLEKISVLRGFLFSVIEEWISMAINYEGFNKVEMESYRKRIKVIENEIDKQFDEL